MTLVLTLLFGLIFSAPPQTASGSVEGTVVRTGSTDPIERVQITLSAPGLPTPLNALTDRDGRFSFPTVAPGRYSVRVQRDGYLVPSAAAEAYPTVTVGSGEQVSGLTYHLTPGGTISGRILDPLGRPAVGADVHALRLVYQEGRPTVRHVKAATTNDRGEYRMFWLEAGNYLIRVEKVLTSGPARAYYPGSATAAGAANVRVDAGAESPKVDVSLQKDVTYKISGFLTSIVAAIQSSPQVQFYLSPEDPGEIYDGDSIASNALTGPEDRAAGKFELRGVRPGTYTLIAVVADRSSTPPRYFSGKTAVDVGFQDANDVNLLVTPGRDLRGRVTYTPSVSPPAMPVRIQLSPKGVLPVLPFVPALSAVAEADGTFAILNVPDFQYSVSVVQLGKDDYVSDLRQGSFSVFDVGTIVPGKSANDDFEVIVDSPGATINGTVAAGATVVLFPDERRQENVLLHKRTNASMEGVFSFRGVTPGRYRLFAFNDLPAGAEFNADFMNGFLGEAQEITVAPGDTTAVELRLITK